MIDYSAPLREPARLMEESYQRGFSDCEKSITEDIVVQLLNLSQNYMEHGFRLEGLAIRSAALLIRAMTGRFGKSEAHK